MFCAHHIVHVPFKKLAQAFSYFRIDQDRIGRDMPKDKTGTRECQWCGDFNTIYNPYLCHGCNMVHCHDCPGDHPCTAWGYKPDADEQQHWDAYRKRWRLGIPTIVDIPERCEECEKELRSNRHQQQCPRCTATLCTPCTSKHVCNADWNSEANAKTKEAAKSLLNSADLKPCSDYKSVHGLGI